jgi:tyrosine decarboxylase
MHMAECRTYIYEPDVGFQTKSHRSCYGAVVNPTFLATPEFKLLSWPPMGSLPLEAMMPLDPETFAGESGAVVGFLADYYRNVDKYPVMANPEPGSIRKLLPDAAPELGESMDRILDDVQRDILPGLTHWQSPSFFAYFPANASSAGFAGEMLSAGLNVVPFVWTASPVATELEQVVVDWMASLLGLPERFHFKGGGGGVLHGSTCEAVVCTLAAARDRALSKLGHEGILKLVVYASDQTHATFQKGASIVGIPPANFRILRTSAESGYGLTADTVQRAVEEDVARGLVPLYLCATIGTTGLGAIDRVRELGHVARRYGISFNLLPSPPPLSLSDANHPLDYMHITI